MQMEGHAPEIEAALFDDEMELQCGQKVHCWPFLRLEMHAT